MPKRCKMVRVVLFEGPLSLTDVLLDHTIVVVHHLRLVNDISRLALSVKRASVLYATVARWVGARKPAEFSVMAADYTGDVGHTTIADIEFVSVEYLAQF